MSEPVEDFLEHYGVKGMRWGKRKGKTDRSTPIPKTKPTKVVSADAAAAKKARDKVKEKGLSSLSNDELKKLNERMQLERNYSNLIGQNKSTVDKGHDHVKSTMALAKTAQEIYGIYNSPLGKLVTEQVKSLVFKR